VALGVGVIRGLDPSCYTPHALHCNAAAWPETNCYIDMWIEVLNALRFDPIAMLPICFTADFEGDQWTFLKPTLEDLFSLYGIDVREMDIWDSISKHSFVQVMRGCLPIIEVDAFFLPDTRGVSYQIEHTKTTICINEMDIDSQWLCYFHNSGYYSLRGSDFQHIFRLDESTNDYTLPPYSEFAKLNSAPPLLKDSLARVSLNIAARHLQRRPRSNPFVAFRNQLSSDTNSLITGSEGFYHKYAFSNIRLLGSAFQMAAVYVRWLENQVTGLELAASAFDTISTESKALLFKLARAANNGKPVQYNEALDTMEVKWQQAFDLLARRVGGD